nr:MAG TPA: hypothetical protein [Bacteriophage sp.]
MHTNITLLLDKCKNSNILTSKQQKHNITLLNCVKYQNYLYFYLVVSQYCIIFAS